MQLYGRSWTRRQIEERVGRIEQIGGVRPIMLADGPDAGAAAVEVRTGSGLDFVVLAGRGMDISLCRFAGAPLSWQSQNGDVHPAFYDARGAEWLRSACGGLLMTCGLTNVGSACGVGGEELGVHGRAHAIAARQLCAEGCWVGDQYEMRVAGEVEQTRIFGENLKLTREIRARVGENRLTLLDVVENLAFAPAPLMLLYHFNFGFPLLAERTTVEFPKAHVVTRDAGVSADGYDRWERPQANLAERVYYHEGITPDATGWTSATIHNPTFPLPGGAGPLAVRLAWRPEQLPYLTQWKMPGQSMHVLGLEPGNCHVEGQAAERQRGTLATLAPGESRSFELVLDVMTE